MAIHPIDFPSGKVGTVVFYEFRGKSVSRSHQPVVKRSEASKLTSGNFGKLSKASRILRELLLPVLTFQKDASIHGRRTGAMMRWLKQTDIVTMPAVNSIVDLKYFDFNKTTSIN